jgi:DNA-directed RNA polymerase specialized sigma24 family protein
MAKRARAADQETIGHIVPELRFMAGQFRSTPAAIDDLVELTIKTAVAEADRRPIDVPVSIWLRRIMNRLVLH